VRSMAGSVVLNDCMLSLYTAVCEGSYFPLLPLKILKVSTRCAGHDFIPDTKPDDAKPAGPSVAAPHSIGVPPEVPSSAPAKFATWC